MGLKITKIIPLKYSYIGCLVRTKLWFWPNKKIKGFLIFTPEGKLLTEKICLKLHRLFTLTLNFWGGRGERDYILRIFLGRIKFRESRTVHQVGFHAGLREGVWISVSWHMQIWMNCHQCWSDCNHGSRQVTVFATHWRHNLIDVRRWYNYIVQHAHTSIAVKKRLR